MIVVRPYTLADFDQLVRIQRECFPPPFPAALWWRREQIASQLAHFPAGALCVVEGDELVGSATCTRIRFDPAHAQHTWDEVADGGYIRTCDAAGDTLYGIDVAVRPAWRGRGVARALYQARFALVRQLGLQRFLAGSRLSGYHRFPELTVEQYADEVVSGRLVDPVITPQLKAGLQPVCALHDYVSDEESLNCALLMQWTPAHSHPAGSQP